MVMDDAGPFDFLPTRISSRTLRACGEALHRRKAAFVRAVGRQRPFRAGSSLAGVYS